MPKKSRPSMHKREREYRKNQRQQKKAERAAAKRDQPAEDLSPEASVPSTLDGVLPPEAR